MSTQTVEGWPDSDIEVISECAICRTGQLESVYEGLIDIEEGVPGHWTMVKCTACDSLLLSPRPTIKAIGKAYQNYYTHAPPALENSILTSRSIIARIAQSYLADRYNLRIPGNRIAALSAKIAWPFRQQLDYFMRNLPEGSGRLLDVGCGNGAFLQRAAKAGWQVEGVEPDPSAATMARTSSDAIVHSSIDNVSRALFDVLTLSHVIEHLHDPANMLKICFKLLRPGGRIWIATPNIAGTGHRVFAAGWQALEIPRHLVMPSASALRSMLVDAGFKSIRFHCRGRGSAKRFQANALRNPSASFLPHWLHAATVDARASMSPLAGEDLVVSAERD